MKFPKYKYEKVIYLYMYFFICENICKGIAKLEVGDKEYGSKNI